MNTRGSILIISSIVTALLLGGIAYYFSPEPELGARTVVRVPQGGTGVGLIVTDTLLLGNGTGNIATATIGSGLTLSGGTLTASGGAAFAWTPYADGVSTSTLLRFDAGFISQASSTIDSTLTVTGLTTLGDTTTIDDIVVIGSFTVDLQNATLTNSTGNNGGAVFVNDNFTVSNGTADFNGAVTMGDGGDNITILGNNWDITSAGFASLVGLTSSASSTFASGINVSGLSKLGNINATSTATSTFATGLDIDTGCFSILGTCVGGGGAGGLTIGDSITSGAVNRILFEDASNLLGESATFIFDGTNFGIGTTTPGTPLSVTGDAVITGTTTATQLKTIGTVEFLGSGTVDQLFYINPGANAVSIGTDEFIHNGTTADIGLYIKGDDVGANTCQGDVIFCIEHNGSYGIQFVAGASNSVFMYFGDQPDPDEGLIRYNNSGDTFTFETKNIVVMTLDNTTGNVFNDTGNSEIDFRLESNTETHMFFMDAGINRIGIGTSTPQFFLSVESDGEGDMFQLFDTDGNCLQDPDSGGITTSCSSDEKLKRNIRDTSFSALDSFQGIKIRDFETKTNNKTHTGVVAQELELTNPEMVRDVVSVYPAQYEEIIDDEGESTFVMISATSTESTKFVQLPSVWQLVKAIQEQQTIIEDLQSRVSALENLGASTISSPTIIQIEKNGWQTLLDWFRNN